jgi:cyanophycin synthetase
VFRAGSSPVIVDYGHNAAALHATGRFVCEAWGGAPVAAVTLPGDRRDDLLMQTAETIAAWFGTVVLYEDSDKRGRPAGQMQELIGSALRSARPGIRCSVAENPADALREAIELAAGGPVLFLYEKLALARDALAAVGAVPWPEDDRTVAGAAAAAEAVAADAAVADAAEAVVASAAAMAITDAADAALARARRKLG